MADIEIGHEQMASISSDFKPLLIFMQVVGGVISQPSKRASRRNKVHMLYCLLVALIAAINPLSYFTTPYIGIVSWLILSWWFYNVNPLSTVRPKNTNRWNPGWWQTLKSLFWGMLFNPIPMFLIYMVILFIARFDATLMT